MDEDRLTQLMHDAVQETPPATFGADDVLGESRRLTARRRAVVRGSSMAAAVVVAAGLFTGLGVVGTGWFGHTVTSNSAGSAPAGGQSGQTSSRVFQPNVPYKAGPQIQQHDFPTSSPMQGGGGVGSVGPSADSTPGGCGSTDGELAVALAGELPSVGDPTPTAVPTTDCPTGTTRSAAFTVRDSTHSGVVVAIVQTGSRDAPEARPGTASASVPTHSGSTLTVLSQPQQAGGVIPFATQVTTFAQNLAGRF